MKREHQENLNGGGGGGCYTPPPSSSSTKGKMMEESQDAGVDELLAALGYKVRSSDMADVAQKLEQLEMAMGTTAAQDDALISHLSTDTVHYNPSDLSTWLESMLSELNAPPPPLPPPSSSSSSNYTTATASTISFAASNNSTPFDLPTFPSSCAYVNPTDHHNHVYGSAAGDASPTPISRNKRMRASNSSSSSSSRGGCPTVTIPPPATAAASEVTSNLPLVVVDSQEAGIRLVHTLMACAEAIQQENLKAADTLVKQISFLAASQGGAMRKVAGYFAEALARRIYRPHPQQDCSLDSTFSDILQMHFYESCPYLKFAHFTANQAILEAFSGCKKVHVIDFGMKQGMQWPALMQALALRPGGPPSLRLTGIGPPQPDNSDALQQVGWKLAQLADTIHVDFEYRGFVANSLADLESNLLQSSEGDDEVEAVAVNSVFELHRLLARPGAIEKVLGTVRALRPKIITMVEQEANHNAGSFTERFTEALHYYSTLFDSLEGGSTVDLAGGQQQDQDQMMSEIYLGRQICNVVACEGPERTERHENLVQWKGRMGRAGFEQVSLGSNAFKQASMLLALFAGGDGYRVEEKDGCLTLGWHTRPLIATSAWRLSESS